MNHIKLEIRMQLVILSHAQTVQNRLWTSADRTRLLLVWALSFMCMDGVDITRDACFLSSNHRLVSGLSLSSSPMGVLPSLFTRPFVVLDGTVVVSGEVFSDKEHQQNILFLVNILSSSPSLKWHQGTEKILNVSFIKQ